ncbi:hypothetical protein Tco_0000613 [Tanacetum coccineum]
MESGGGEVFFMRGFFDEIVETIYSVERIGVGVNLMRCNEIDVRSDRVDERERGVREEGWREEEREGKREREREREGKEREREEEERDGERDGWGGERERERDELRESLGWIL